MSKSNTKHLPGGVKFLVSLNFVAYFSVCVFLICASIKLSHKHHKGKRDILYMSQRTKYFPQSESEQLQVQILSALNL